MSNGAGSVRGFESRTRRPNLGDMAGLAGRMEPDRPPHSHPNGSERWINPGSQQTMEDPAWLSASIYWLDTPRYTARAGGAGCVWYGTPYGMC